MTRTGSASCGGACPWVWGHIPIRPCACTTSWPVPTVATARCPHPWKCSPPGPCRPHSCPWCGPWQPGHVSACAPCCHLRSTSATCEPAARRCGRARTWTRPGKAIRCSPTWGNRPWPAFAVSRESSSPKGRSTTSSRRPSPGPTRCWPACRWIFARRASPDPSQPPRHSSRTDRYVSIGATEFGARWRCCATNCWTRSAACPT